MNLLPIAAGVGLLILVLGKKASASGQTPTSSQPVAPKPDLASSATVRQGSTGPLVVDLQARLNEYGMSTPALQTDGKFGPLTLAAVKAFQASRGLKVDGIVGPQTWAALAAG